MRTRAVIGMAAVLATTLGPVTSSHGAEAGARKDSPPQHTITVEGPGVVSTYPELTTGIDRYAVTTDGDADGSLEVTASTTDPTGRVRVDGRPVESGSAAELTGLAPGDEVNVLINDSSGRVSRSFIYLPPHFPQIDSDGEPSDPDRYAFIDLANFLVPSPFEAVVDGNGVPVFVRSGRGADLRVSGGDPQHYQVTRLTDDGYTVHELSDTFAVVSSWQLSDHPASTDFHDNELLPGGGALLMGYDGATRAGHGWIDAVIEVQDAEHHPVFTWNSKDHVDPSEAFVTGPGGMDYAHINALDHLANGDVLASFRNLSQVMRIATTAHDGYQAGDVIWRFGGKLNDFTFLDDPSGGPCAQHDAKILPNGHLLLFDNGSRTDADNSQTGPMCPGAGNGAVERPQTRVAEYALDEDAMTATLVWSYQVPGRYTRFAGSVQRLPDDDTFIGWAAIDGSIGSPLATEVTPAGDVVWSLSALGWTTYRAYSYPAPDRLAPEIDLTGVDGTEVVEGSQPTADYGCTDTGGSNLQRCGGDVPPGSVLDTSFGAHSLVATAEDGAGNVTHGEADYTVVRTDHQPDLRVREHGGRWAGVGYWGGPGPHAVTLSGQIVDRTGVATVRLRNRGTSADRIRVQGTGGNGRVEVRYVYGTRDVTGKVVTGTFKKRLAPGEGYLLRVELTRLPGKPAAPVFTALLEATSMRGSGQSDKVAVRLRTP